VVLIPALLCGQQLEDMNPTYWVANHFDAVSPIDKKKSQYVMGQSHSGNTTAEDSNLNVTGEEYRRMQNIDTNNDTMQDKPEKQTVIDEGQNGEKSTKKVRYSTKQRNKVNRKCQSH
jgi:hypothetical protein